MTAKPSALALAVLGAYASLFQQPLRFSARTDTVIVYATATADGRLVTDLTEGDFTILDDGQRREIVAFSNERQPITVGLVLDRSGSTSQLQADVVSAAEAFVGRLADGDRASLMTLMYDCLPLTGERQRLAPMIRAGGSYGDQGSPIWSALDRGLKSLAREPGPRALLLFSDGDDTGPLSADMIDSLLHLPHRFCHPVSLPSRSSAGAIRREAARDGVRIYAVGIDGRTRTDMRQGLVAVAADTGGEYHALERPSQLREAFSRIADELHHQYAIGFVPAAFDEKEHRIEVKSTRPGVRVRARTRYVATVRPSPGESSEIQPEPMLPPSPLTPLSDDEVDRAIAEGRDGREAGVTCVAEGLIKDHSGRSWPETARVTLEGPMDRVVRWTRAALERSEPVTRERIDTDVRAPALRVRAEYVPRPGAPAVPARGIIYTLDFPRITVVRLRSDDATRPVLHPTSVVAENSPGNRLSPFTGSERLTSMFDLSAFRALPGAIDVVVYSAQGERKCRLTPEDRARIR